MPNPIIPEPPAIVKSAVGELISAARSIYANLRINERNALERAVELGQMIERIKRECNAGEFLACIEKVGIPQQRASEYRRIAALPDNVLAKCDSLNDARQAIKPDTQTPVSPPVVIPDKTSAEREPGCDDDTYVVPETNRQGMLDSSQPAKAPIPPASPSRTDRLGIKPPTPFTVPGGETGPSKPRGSKPVGSSVKVKPSNQLPSDPTVCEKCGRPFEPTGPKANVKFVKPTVEEVAAYCRERKNKVDAQAFHDFYTSKGWVVGKSPMKNWQAAVRTWEKNDKARGGYKEQFSGLKAAWRAAEEDGTLDKEFGT